MSKHQDAKIITMITENDLAKLIVNKAYDIHSCLGPGLLESVYQPTGFKL